MENLTAKMSCFARAYHYKTNERPIFGDSAAAALLGGDYDAIAAHIAQGIQFFAPGFTGSADEALKITVDGQLSPSVLGRSAFAEQSLMNEARLGCRQYVLFAAGYDTFALRAPVQGLRVYELDQPELIADKKRRIERSGIEEKSAVEYIPCDLADAEWKTLLRGAGFKAEGRTSPSEACSASATIWTETLSAACSGRSPTCGRTAPRYALTTRRRTAQARRAGTNSSRARRGRA